MKDNFLKRTKTVEEVKANIKSLLTMFEFEVYDSMVLLYLGEEMINDEQIGELTNKHVILVRLFKSLPCLHNKLIQELE